MKSESPKGAAANRRPALQPDGSGNLFAIVAADRAFPAAVAELGRSAHSRPSARGRKETGEWGQTNKGQAAEGWIRLSSIRLSFRLDNEVWSFFGDPGMTLPNQSPDRMTSSGFSLGFHAGIPDAARHRSARRWP
jgi:hypothetical protein